MTAHLENAPVGRDSGRAGRRSGKKTSAPNGCRASDLPAGAGFFFLGISRGPADSIPRMASEIFQPVWWTRITRRCSAFAPQPDAETRRMAGRPDPADLLHLGQAGARPCAKAGKAKSWLFTTLYREFLRGPAPGRAAWTGARGIWGRSMLNPPAPEVDVCYREWTPVSWSEAPAGGGTRSYRAPADPFLPAGFFLQGDRRGCSRCRSAPSWSPPCRAGKAQLRTTLARKESAGRNRVVPFNTPSAEENSHEQRRGQNSSCRGYRSQRGRLPTM